MAEKSRFAEFGALSKGLTACTDLVESVLRGVKPATALVDYYMDQVALPPLAQQDRAPNLVTPTLLGDIFPKAFFFGVTGIFLSLYYACSGPTSETFFQIQIQIWKCLVS